MPEEPGKLEETKEDWLKIELFIPAELSDALANFLTEMGAEGVFQESPEPPSSHDCQINHAEGFMLVFGDMARASLWKISSRAFFPNARGRQSPTFSP